MCNNVTLLAHKHAKKQEWFKNKIKSWRCVNGDSLTTLIEKFNEKKKKRVLT
jgi:hypothetical protein